MTAENTLIYGDNLDILRHHVASESVDLIISIRRSIPSATTTCFSIEKSGEASPAQIEAFTDTSAWDLSAKRA